MLVMFGAQIVARLADKEKVRVLYLRSSLSAENDHFAAQVSEFARTARRLPPASCDLIGWIWMRCRCGRSGASPAATMRGRRGPRSARRTSSLPTGAEWFTSSPLISCSSCSRLLSLRDDDDDDDDDDCSGPGGADRDRDRDRGVLSPSVNPLSPQREATTTCSLQEALGRRRTTRLFLCWATPPHHRDRDRDRDRGKVEEDSSFHALPFKQVCLLLSIPDCMCLFHPLPSPPWAAQEKAVDLDRCGLVRQGSGQWAQCVLLTSSPGPGAGAGAVQLAVRMDDPQQLGRMVQGLEEILRLRTRS